MKKQLVILGIIALLLIVGLSGCTETVDQEKFIGTWSGTRRTADSQQTYSQADITIIFYSDGTVHELHGAVYELDETSRTGTYKIIDGKLHTYILDFETVYDVTFTNNYKSLSLVFRAPPEYGDMADFITLDKQNTEGQIETQNKEPTDDGQKVTNAEPEKFLGTWYGQTEQPGHKSHNLTIIFYPSGNELYNNGTSLNRIYRYRVEGDKLYIDYPDPDYDLIPDIFGYSFTNDYTSLILTLLNPLIEDDEGFTFHLNKQYTYEKIPELKILKNVSYSYLDTWVSVDGIIKNVADVPINNVKIRATLYDKSGNIIKTNQRWDDDLIDYLYDSPHPGYIKPGETSFFTITFQDVRYYDHYRIEIASFNSGYSEGCREGLVISNIKDNIAEYTLNYEVTGNVKNDGSNKQEIVSVWGAFYDSHGSLICISQDYTLPLDMYSGQSEEFEITVMNFMIDSNRISNYDLKIDAFCYTEG